MGRRASGRKGKLERCRGNSKRWLPAVGAEFAPPWRHARLGALKAIGPARQTRKQASPGRQAKKAAAGASTELKCTAAQSKWDAQTSTQDVAAPRAPAG